MQIFSLAFIHLFIFTYVYSPVCDYSLKRCFVNLYNFVVAVVLMIFIYWQVRKHIRKSIRNRFDFLTIPRNISINDLCLSYVINLVSGTFGFSMVVFAYLFVCFLLLFLFLFGCCCCFCVELCWIVLYVVLWCVMLLFCFSFVFCSFVWFVCLHVSSFANSNEPQPVREYAYSRKYFQIVSICISSCLTTVHFMKRHS